MKGFISRDISLVHGEWLAIKIQIEHEHNNVKDSNAIKLSVFHNNKWYVIGYCGVKNCLN